MNSFRVIFGQPYRDTGELFIGNKSALACDVVPLSCTRLSLRKKSSFQCWGRTHQAYPISSSLQQSDESGGAVSSYVPPETAASSHTGQRDSHGRRPPAAAHSHSHSCETEQDMSKQWSYDDLCTYQQQLQSRAIVINFSFNYSQFEERLVWLSRLSRCWRERQWWSKGGRINGE